MTKKVLFISTSLHIQFCIGCLVCQSKGACVLKDDVAEIMAKVKGKPITVYTAGWTASRRQHLRE